MLKADLSECSRNSVFPTIAGKRDSWKTTGCIKSQQRALRLLTQDGWRIGNCADWQRPTGGYALSVMALLRFLRIESPLISIRCALWSSPSRMPSAAGGSPICSCQPATGRKKLPVAQRRHDPALGNLHGVVQRRRTCGNHSGLFVKTIPGKAKKRSPCRRNRRSPSARNLVHLRPETLFTFTLESRSPSRGIRNCRLRAWKSANIR